MAQKKKPAKKSGEPKPSAEVCFDYIKSNFYRAIHADGIYGGVTPRGYIHMSVWNQRNAIPQHLFHAVDEEGHLGEELRREGREAIIREVDVDVFMDAEVAKALVIWLIPKIEQAEAMRRKIAKQEEDDSE